jgi:hypothetical protein
MLWLFVLCFSLLLLSLLLLWLSCQCFCYYDHCRFRHRWDAYAVASR